jgi:hypothetical protein
MTAVHGPNYVDGLLWSIDLLGGNDWTFPMMLSPPNENPRPISSHEAEEAV